MGVFPLGAQVRDAVARGLGKKERDALGETFGHRHLPEIQCSRMPAYFVKARDLRDT
jgi:hypothetical protein